ncbi:MAG TPA: hypothetical protein VJG65_00450 [Patescibacteria group bacterium]|nr:hypothetical protein [Patescibacteria group bacterium]
MVKNLTVTASRTKVSGKVMTILVVMAIAGGAYVVAATLGVKVNQKFTIVATGPKQAEISPGKYLTLGTYEISTGYQDWVVVDSIKFTSPLGVLTDKIEHLELMREYDCGYGYGDSSGKCYTPLASQPALNGQGEVTFYLKLLVNKFNSARLAIVGEIQNFQNPNKKDPKIWFNIKKNTDVVARLYKPCGYGYGYGDCDYPVIYPNVGKAKGTIFTVKLTDIPPVVTQPKLDVMLARGEESASQLVLPGIQDQAFAEIIIDARQSNTDASIKTLGVLLSTWPPAQPNWLSDIKVWADDGRMLPVTNGTAAVLASSATPGSNLLMSLHWPNNERLLVQAGQIVRLKVTADLSPNATRGYFSFGLPVQGCLEDAYSVINGQVNPTIPALVNCFYNLGVPFVATSISQ